MDDQWLDENDQTLFDDRIHQSTHTNIQAQIIQAINYTHKNNKTLYDLTL